MKSFQQYGLIFSALVSMDAIAAIAVERISVNAAGEQGNAISERPTVADGGNLVVFTSLAFNLVPGDFDDSLEFGYSMLRDRSANSTVWVVEPAVRSRSIDSPALSRDSQFVAFVTGQTNLVPGDTSQPDVFRKRLSNGLIERVNQPPGGGNSIGSIDSISLSGDGRFVAFDSSAGDLVPGDNNGFSDVFVRDMNGATIERISVNSNGEPTLDGNSRHPAITADGRFVAFSSAASQLGPPTNTLGNVFVRDRTTGTTSRVSIGVGGAEPNGSSGFGGFRPSISDNGRWVLFGSDATNLVVGDTNGRSDIFLADRQDGSISRVSTDLNGGQLSLSPSEATMSADGSRIVYGIRLTASDPLVLFDRPSGIRIMLNGDAEGQARGRALQPSISADGNFVVIRGTDAILPVSGNNIDDVFLFDITEVMHVFDNGFE